MTTVTWLGTAGLKIEHEGQCLLIDPYFSRPSKLKHLRPLVADHNRIDTELAAIEAKIRGVLVGHCHSDHVLDIPWIIRRTGVKAYGNPSLGNLFYAEGMEERATVVRLGIPFSIGPFEILGIKSPHGKVIFGKEPFPGEISRDITLPMMMSGYRHGGVISWLVRVGGVSIFHGGSADLYDEYLKGLTADVLFLCAPGRQYTPNFTKRMCDALQPKIVLPFHYDDFFTAMPRTKKFKHVTFSKLDDFIREIAEQAPDAKIIVPQPMEPMEF